MHLLEDRQVGHFALREPGDLGFSGPHGYPPQTNRRDVDSEPLRDLFRLLKVAGDSIGSYIESPD